MWKYGNKNMIAFCSDYLCIFPQTEIKYELLGYQRKKERKRYGSGEKKIKKNC